MYANNNVHVPYICLNGTGIHSSFQMNMQILLNVVHVHINQLNVSEKDYTICVQLSLLLGVEGHAQFLSHRREEA